MANVIARGRRCDNSRPGNPARMGELRMGVRTGLLLKPNRLDLSVHGLRSRRLARIAIAAFAAGCALLSARPASAEALLLVDVESGKVLHAETATYPWYP